ncbi:hypothetical protein T09_9929 [Trichinella sp. T9]|nr:hypothetical protein T09_9929 [Trichinella sp. T9]
MSMQNVLRYALANNSTLALAISQYRKVNDELLALSKSARKKPRRTEKAFLQLSLQELTDISILFMQADLDIHFSHDRLRVHSQLAKMDENLLPVGSCKKGLSVWASGSLLPCNAESQKRNFVHRANCCRWVRCVSDDQNVNDKTVRRRCSYKLDLILGQKENRPAKMTPESPDFGFACFAILFALWCQDAGNEAVEFDSVNIDFAKLDGEQFCRLHSGHLRRSVPNGSNLHDARNCVSAIRRCKEEDSFAEMCVPQTPRRTDLSYMNPQVEDSHPFPLIVSELASGHEKNVFPSPPA